jgi:hypothetical protein
MAALYPCLQTALSKYRHDMGFAALDIATSWRFNKWFGVIKLRQELRLQ